MNKKLIISIFFFIQLFFLLYIIEAIAVEDYVGVEVNQTYEYSITIQDKGGYEDYIDDGNKDINFRIDLWDNDVEKFKIDIKEIAEEDKDKIDGVSTKGVELSVVYSDSQEKDNPSYGNEDEDEIIIYDGDDINNLSLANLIFDYAWFIGTEVDADDLEDAFFALLATRASSWNTVNSKVKIDESEETDQDNLIIILDSVAFLSLPEKTDIRLDYHLDTGHLWYVHVKYGGDDIYSLFCDGPTAAIPGYSLNFLLLIFGIFVMGLVYVTNRNRKQF